MDSEKKYTEREVELRVAFKMGELSSFIQQEKNRMWHQIAYSKQVNGVILTKFEYIKEIEERLFKEIKMNPPTAFMEESEFRELRDEYVNKFNDKFNKRGTKDYHKYASWIADRLCEFYTRIMS